ncbi:MAG: hypothetical protein IJG32_09945, partial [Selenomonadaceae bacterium]|nr:hypothetical protein [Selenomonadaceae bacterium]
MYQEVEPAKALRTKPSVMDIAPLAVPPAMTEPTNSGDFDVQRFGTYEENKERFKHHNLPNGIVHVTRSAIHFTPFAVTEIINKKGGITRNFYDENGDQYLQISNNDHGNIAESKYGKHGEHAHDYELTPDKSGVKSRPSRA